MVYTEPIPAEEIIQHIEKRNDINLTKDILIVGCSVCANISCGYYQGAKEPAMSIFLKPLAIEKEIEKIASKLKENYNSVDSINIKGLCGISTRSERKIIEKSKDTDTIIIMSCPGGLKAVESYLDNKKLIMGMRVRGFKSPKIKLKARGIFLE